MPPARYDIAFGDINSLIKFRDNPDNAKVKAVAMVYNTPAFSIVSLKKNGIAKPKDLEGKILGAPAPDGAYAQWPIFMKVNGIDASKVKIENVGFPVREPMLAQGKVDAITGFSFSSFMNLKANNVPADDIVVMLMRDFGLDLYGNALMASPKFAAENPKAVAGFVRATLKGMQETIKSPETAVKSVIAKNQIANEAVELERLKMAIAQNIVTKEVDAIGLGRRRHGPPVEVDRPARRSVRLQEQAEGRGHLRSAVPAGQGSAQGEVRTSIRPYEAR